MKTGILLCAVLGSAASPALASQPTEGTLRTQKEDGAKDVVDVPLKHTEVTIRVNGLLADVEVEQTFRNPFSRKIDAVYLFPLPTGAAVNQMDLVTGGRTVKGEIHEKAQAKRIFQAARREGHVAALLLQERPNLFQQAVANLEPDAEVRVKIHYVQALPYEAGAYELVFPMVAGPRYVPKDSKVDARAVLPAVLPAGRRSSHDIGLTVELEAGLPIGGLSSPSHTLALEGPNGSRARVRLGAGDTIPNKDFVLRWVVAGEAPRFAVLTHREGKGDGSFYLMAQPPAQAAQAPIAPRELVFVLDTSSSMRGAPLAKARELIRVALGALRPEDTFQIVRFDDQASALGPRPIAAKAKNVELALDWLGKLEAGGGTEMTTGIRAAFDLPHDPARLKLVVFLTDGYIGNEDEILAEVQDRLGDARLFAFGVGTAVNRYLLEEMATIGRGTAQVIRPDEDTAQVVAAFHRRIARPVLTDLRIDWNGLEAAELTPRAIPDLFLDQPLVLSGKYRRPGSATITVRGRQGGREVSFQVPVRFPEKDARPAVASVWARARIAELSRRQLRGERPELRREILGLALEQRLMSPYTAFVVVDQSRVTAGGEAETVAVPVAMPEAPRGGHAVPMEPMKAMKAAPMHYDADMPYGGEGGGGYAAASEETRRDPAPVAKAEPAPVPPPVQQAQLKPKSGSSTSASLASAHRQALSKCLDGLPGSGKMNVRLKVDAKGNVTDATATGVPAGVANCAVTAARKLKLPASADVAAPAAVEANFVYAH